MAGRLPMSGVQAPGAATVAGEPRTVCMPGVPTPDLGNSGDRPRQDAHAAHDLVRSCVARDDREEWPIGQDLGAHSGRSLPRRLSQVAALARGDVSGRPRATVRRGGDRRDLPWGAETWWKARTWRDQEPRAHRRRDQAAEGLWARRDAPRSRCVDCPPAAIRLGRPPARKLGAHRRLEGLQRRGQVRLHAPQNDPVFVGRPARLTS